MDDANNVEIPQHPLPTAQVEESSEEGVTNFENITPSIEPTPNANEEDGMYSPSNVPKMPLTLG